MPDFCLISQLLTSEYPWSCNVAGSVGLTTFDPRKNIRQNRYTAEVHKIVVLAQSVLLLPNPAHISFKH